MLIATMNYNYTEADVRAIGYLASVGINVGTGNINLALYNTGKYGTITIVNQLVRLGIKRYNELLWGACRSGNEAIMRLAIRHGANRLDLALLKAKRGGHKQIIEKLIILGATRDHVELYGCEDQTLNRFVEDQLSAEFYTIWHRGVDLDFDWDSFYRHD